MKDLEGFLQRYSWRSNLLAILNKFNENTDPNFCMITSVPSLIPITSLEYAIPSSDDEDDEDDEHDEDNEESTDIECQTYN